MPEAGSADPRHLAVLRPVTGADLADLTTWQERDLPGAIESGQLALRYQPIVDLPDGRIVAVEALATWDHPEHGMIPPDEFIEVAERSDVILTLGAWVLDTACAQVRAWQISTPALRNSLRSCPEPSVSGGVHAGPNTSGSRRARNGSSSAISSGEGSPRAIISEF